MQIVTHENAGVGHLQKFTGRVAEVTDGQSFEVHVERRAARVALTIPVPASSAAAMARMNLCGRAQTVGSESL
jgi:hypothetical protein